MLTCKLLPLGSFPPFFFLALHKLYRPIEQKIQPAWGTGFSSHRQNSNKRQANSTQLHVLRGMYQGIFVGQPWRCVATSTKTQYLCSVKLSIFPSVLLSLNSAGMAAKLRNHPTYPLTLALVSAARIPVPCRPREPLPPPLTRSCQRDLHFALRTTPRHPPSPLHRPWEVVKSQPPARAPHHNDTCTRPQCTAPP